MFSVPEQGDIITVSSSYCVCLPGEGRGYTEGTRAVRHTGTHLLDSTGSPASPVCQTLCTQGSLPAVTSNLSLHFLLNNFKVSWDLHTTPFLSLEPAGGDFTNENASSAEWQLTYPIGALRRLSFSSPCLQSGTLSAFGACYVFCIRRERGRAVERGHTAARSGSVVMQCIYSVMNVC